MTVNIMMQTLSLNILVTTDHGLLNIHQIDNRNPISYIKYILSRPCNRPKSKKFHKFFIDH